MERTRSLLLSLGFLLLTFLVTFVLHRSALSVFFGQDDLLFLQRVEGLDPWPGGIRRILSVRTFFTVCWRVFGDRPVTDWFNPMAPRVKTGEVRPQELDEARALDLMIADPILIRRPLLETDAGVCCGFEPGPALDYLGVHLGPSQDMQSCSRPGPDASCEPPGGA